MQKLRRGDCDQTGIERYGLPVSRLTHRNGEVVAAQVRLRDEGFLKDKDVDGNVGPGTLSAIEKWETAHREDFYTGKPWVPVGDVGGKHVMIPDVPFTCQAWHAVDLGPNDPCRKSGCLSCCVDITLAVRDSRPVDIPGFITGFKAVGGYDDRARIIWGVLMREHGLKHEDRIDIDSACEHIESGTPCLIDIGGHWVLAVGWDESGFHCHDVGYRLGNCYENPGRTEGKPTTYTTWNKVQRIDVLI